jgi:hypothetical protein
MIRQSVPGATGRGKEESPRFSPGAFMFCGPKGIRTPDLLDANEARYQLRHRPVNEIYAITTKAPLASERHPAARRESSSRTCASISASSTNPIFA